jgi:ribosomal protein S12 methylthiotransferase accessory factor YcaO
VQGATRFDPEVMYGRGDSIPFSSVQSFVHADIADDIRFMLDRLLHAGFTQVVAVDLTRPQVGMPVIRVIVPRAEAWPVFQMHARRGTFGSRIAELLQVTHSLADELEEGNTWFEK